MQINTPPPSEHLLDDIDPVVLAQAIMGQRFINMIIDRVAFYLTWRVILNFTIPYLVKVMISPIEHRVLFYVEFYLLVVAYDLVLMTMQEYLTGGKTLGKYATRTRAVNEDGTRITFQTALLRSLCRLIPFEAFSALSDPPHPWHDRWTKTYVIDEKQSTLPVIQS